MGQSRRAEFLRDYTAIRAAEGHGFAHANELMNLPHASKRHPHAGIWRIRQRSYDVLVRKVLPRFGTRLRILDLGAGVGWLSYRLAQLGHQPSAIDFNPDASDGLTASRHYATTWPRVLADFDYLPLKDSSFDRAIFNGSFHYSTDYTATLREAFRVARAVVVMDSPIYRDRSSGLRMVAERQEAFRQPCGTRSDAIASRQFLTWDELKGLGQWTAYRPWYGLRWAARPIVARIRRQREPATFALLVATQAMVETARQQTRAADHG